MLHYRDFPPLCQALFPTLFTRISSFFTAPPKNSAQSSSSEKTKSSKSSIGSYSTLCRQAQSSPKQISPTAVGAQNVTGKVTVPDGYELKSGLSDTVTVSVTVRAAGVTTVTGDADGDGEISDWDDILLQRYLANWPGIEINLDAMDIDGDGEVSDWDDVLLQRYLAGWPIELG